MADTYLQLIAQLQDTLGRADASTARCDYFIDNAENWFNNNLRARQMETTNGNFTVTSGSFALPTDWLKWKRLYKVVGGRTCELRPILEEQAAIYNPGGAASSATRYLVRGSNTVLIPSESPQVGGTYYQKVPPLTGTAPTNWLLTAHQDAYVYGSLVGAEMFFANDARMPTWKALFQEAVAGIDAQKQFSNQAMQMTYQGPVY